MIVFEGFFSVIGEDNEVAILNPVPVNLPRCAVLSARLDWTAVKDLKPTTDCTLTVVIRCAPIVCK
jgi:hypothetical protein